MKKTLIVLLTLISLSVVSQVATPIQVDKKVKIELSVSELQTIIKALEGLPYKESAGIIATIVEQGNKQLADTTSKKK